MLAAERVPWWCSVDVTDEGGLVRRGRICSRAPDGFFVDFGYPGHTKEFVPCDNCVIHQAQPPVVDYSSGDAVEAVYQSAPDQPSRWYPATFLAGSRDRFAFVTINTGDKVVEKVVYLNAVRKGNESKLFGSDILYFEHEFEIPKSGDLAKLTSLLVDKVVRARFLEFLTFETAVVCVTLEGGRLVYASQHQSPFKAKYMEGLLDRMAKTCLPSGAVSSVLMDGPGMTELPLEIMREILSCLSLVHQVPCRKTCEMWNALVISVMSKGRVEIDITRHEERSPTVEYHQLATRMHQSVTASTRILILSGDGGMQERPTIRSLDTVRLMLVAMRLRVPIIVLSGVSVQAHDLLDCWYSADTVIMHHSKWRDVCDSLILHNVAVWLPFVAVSVMVTKEVLDVQENVGVENVLDKWCPEISGSATDALASELCELWKFSQNRWYLMLLLSLYQPADERFPWEIFGTFSPLHIPAGILSVPPLASLRRLTVLALTGFNRSWLGEEWKAWM